jgi:hypothetical protein
MERSFTTSVNIDNYPFGIDYLSSTLFLGSCFAESIGNKMLERKFPVLINPFGVVYNPVSVALALKRIISAQPLVEDDLNTYNNLWFSFYHHTSFSSSSQEECLKKINVSLRQANNFWREAKFLAITFGTARVYHHKKMGIPVANCHKIPAREFKHSLLSVSEIVDLWSDLLDGILKVKKDLKIIFTVSPVRHWKDGPVGNQISKSTLVLAVSQLVEKFSMNAFYFPSYEIVMDELRDYRFYADDMLHISSRAIDHIWDKFRATAIATDARRISLKVEEILAAVNHRPFNPKSKDFISFVENTLEKINELKRENPSFSFSHEISVLQEYLL